MAAGGIEPGSFKSSGEYANHYTTVTPLVCFLQKVNSYHRELRSHVEILPRTGESLTFWDTKQTFGYMNPRIMNPSANDSSFCQNHSAFSLGIPLLQPTASGEGFLSFRLNDSGFRGIICFRIHDSGIHITLGLFGIPSGKGFTSPRQISTWDLLSKRLSITRGVFYLNVSLLNKV